jgi:hypothetical protein
MLAAWWLATVEIPGHMLFRMYESNWVARSVGPITVWAFGFTSKLSGLRIPAFIIIIAAVFIHSWLWKRHAGWDAYGQWVFKAGFFVLYAILYAIFILVFLGAEVPVWTWPSELTQVLSSQ